MIKLPKQLKIGGHTYKILYPYKFAERTDLYGQCDGDVMEIRLMGVDGGNNELPLTHVYQSLIHEVFHAIDRVIRRRLFTGKEGEDTLDALAESVLQVIVDNRQALLELLMELGHEDEQWPPGSVHEL